MHCRQYLELAVAVPARHNSHERAHLAPWNPGEGGGGHAAGGGPSAGRWERRLDALPRLQCNSMRRLEAMLRLLSGSGDVHEEPPLSAVGTLTLGNPKP